jgi:CheY-like chemotaxis protein
MFRVLHNTGCVDAILVKEVSLSLPLMTNCYSQMLGSVYEMDCKNVLIIEDDAAIRSMMKSILEIEGFAVFEACDGAEGLTVLRKILPLPCVILLDLMMPGSNGWDFLDVQRNEPSLKDVPVVICSAYSASARAVKPDAFVAKPVQLNDLLSAIYKFCA